MFRKVAALNTRCDSEEVKIVQKNLTQVREVSKEKTTLKPPAKEQHLTAEQREQLVHLHRAADGNQERVVIVNKDMDCLPMANQEVTDTSTEGDNFQRTYEALTLENNMLIEQLVHLHCAAEEQKEQLSVLKKDRDLLSFQNGYLHREVANMTADRDNYKRTYETTTLENNDLREQLVHLYCAVEEQKEQLRVLSKDRDILSFQNGYLYREVANISAEKDNFKTAAYKTTTLENNKLREQLVDLRCTVDEAKEELRVTNEYKDLLLSGNKYLHQQVEDISAKMVDLKRRYDAADLENGQLRKQLADLEDALKETAATLLSYLQKKQPALTQPIMTPEVQEVSNDTRIVAKDATQKIIPSTEQWVPTVSCVAPDGVGNICNDMSAVEERAPRMVNLENFDVLDLLGTGGCGKVFLVRKRDGADAGRFYALKMLDKAEIIRKKQCERVVMEQIVYKRIGDELFLVKLHYAFQTESKLFLVTDCYEGDLSQLLEERGRLRECFVKFYLAEIILGTEKLHKLGFVHRDLKPENILIDSTGHIAVADYGGCEHVAYRKKIERSGVFGTSWYMSPEMNNGQGFDPTADWWSIGIIAYQLVTGELPFADSEDPENQIMTDIPVMPEELSPALKDLITGLLVKEPEKRLGAGEKGAQEIKEHPFFHDVNWSDVAQKAVVTPCLPEPRDMHFDEAADLEYLVMEVACQKPITGLEECNTTFKGFSFVAATPTSAAS